MRNTALTCMLIAGGLCSPLMALNVIETDIADARLTITFDEEITVPTEELSGFEVADKRYGRFVPATATVQGNKVTLQYESHVSPRVQQQTIIWRYTGAASALTANAATPLQSYTGDIEFKAVPLGKFPSVGKIRIACVGDSITFGYGIGDVQKRYPETLGRILGERFQVGRFGNSGKTAGKCQPGRWYGEQKEFTQAIDFQADVYICNLGINDTSNDWWDPAVSERDFSTLIEAFQGPQHATVVLWSKLGPDFRGTPGKKTYPGNVFKGYQFSTADNGTAAHRPTMEKIITKLARKHKCKTMDAYTAMAKNPELYKVDGLHPTPEGAAKLAELTAAWLYKHYKKP